MAEFTNNAEGAAAQGVQDAVAGMSMYPWERLNVEVTFETVNEPSCVGHVEFACTQRTSRVPEENLNRYLVEFRTGFGNPSPPPFAPEWAGQKFVTESAAHELGHVVADYFILTHEDPSVVAEVASWFTHTDPATGNVKVGSGGAWASGEWQDRIQEAVAETFKDIFLPKAQRVYDNRTNWTLNRNKFLDFLQIMGMRPWGNTVSREVQGAYYSPTIAEQAAVFGGADPSTQYHADLQSFAVAEGQFWAAKGLSAAGLGAPVPFGDTELAQGVIGGAAPFTLGDLVFAGGSGPGGQATGRGGINIELDMEMVPDFTLEYAHDFDPDFPHYNPETWEYVGWSPGLWWEYKTWGYWELYWVVMLRPEEGPDFSSHLISTAADYLNSMTYREELGGVAPAFSGSFPAPTKDGLAAVLGEWADDIASITLNFRVECWRDDGPESTIRFRGAIPAGPGVIEDWATRFWTASWSASVDPDKLPPWPYADEPPQASPGPSGRIRRSRARGGLLA